jgi:hypothetical protein
MFQRPQWRCPENLLVVEASSNKLQNVAFHTCFLGKAVMIDIFILLFRDSNFKLFLA